MLFSLYLISTIIALTVMSRAFLLSDPTFPYRDGHFHLTFHAMRRIWFASFFNIYPKDNL